MVPTHLKNRNRFVLELDDGEAELTYRRVSDTVLDFVHTYVPPAARGAGIASRLVTEGFEYAREHGYTVIPSCPYVAAFVRKHGEYHDLIA